MLTDLPKVIRLRKNWVSMFLNMCFFLPLLIFKNFLGGGVHTIWLVGS